ncbi:tRNA (adenosine(37)-N6)-threonylcarbamoyltransferase complex transferase subunit TsaD [Spirochaetota bacterium]
MTVLGIESSCDECAAAIVRDGRIVLSSIVASQISMHEEYEGVVPEIASRLHAEWIMEVGSRAFKEANLEPADIDGLAVTVKPGLAGALLVGLSFTKALAWSLGKPFVGVNHILAHLYASQLSEKLPYPFIGLVASGGHSLICKVDGFDEISVLGTTIDDAIGEAFDKVAKHYNFGYPGGPAIDRLARKGNPKAYNFPVPNLYKGENRYNLSYSGLKTAAIHQVGQFHVKGYDKSPENLAASFEKAAVDLLVSRLIKACRDTGISTIVAGGGVAANSYLRQCFSGQPELKVVFPPLALCGDNAAMVAGIGCKMLERGDMDSLSLNASPRVYSFKKPSLKTRINRNS